MPELATDAQRRERRILSHPPRSEAPPAPRLGATARCARREPNRDRDALFYVFGFGSLVWRPALPRAPVAAVPGYILHYKRTFWQASTDHRGTEASPGRVATLTPADGERCYGVAYGIAPEDVDAVLAYLDVREQDGYSRERVTVYRHEVGEKLGERDSEVLCRGALVYIATASNVRYLREESERTIDALSRCIVGARGPSGTNVEYLYRLHDALAAMRVEDEHVAALVRAVRALEEAQRRPRGGADRQAVENL